MFNGNKLRKLREQKGWLQEDLATRLNLSSSTIGMYEQNRRQPDNESLKTMSKIFNVTVDYLLDNEEVNQIVEEQTEERKKILESVVVGLDDPLTKTLFSKASELKNDKDKQVVLNVIESFMKDVDDKYE